MLIHKKKLNSSKIINEIVMYPTNERKAKNVFRSKYFSIIFQTCQFHFSASFLYAISYSENEFIFYVDNILNIFHNPLSTNVWEKRVFKLRDEIKMKRESCFKLNSFSIFYKNTYSTKREWNSTHHLFIVR